MGGASGRRPLSDGERLPSRRVIFAARRSGRRRRMRMHYAICVKGYLDTFFPAVRAGVLSATFLQPDHWWFMTELARHLGVAPSSLQGELESLETYALLLRRYDGPRTYFKAELSKLTVK
jgi:hypothetical protein